jgi:predicted O-linked N-acetylglucosamine transferase (SPINDLY family)
MNPLAEAKRLFLEALAMQEKGDLEQAEILYGKALALAPERPSVMNNLAMVLFQLKKYAESKYLCERLLEINPQDAVALLNLGNCQVKLNSAEEALVSYERALKIRPDDADAQANRAIALLEMKRPREALESCDRALAVKPDLAEALSNRAKALRELERPQEALESFERALEIRPVFFEALQGLGNALVDLGRYQEAVESYEKALAISPDFEYLPGTLAWARTHCCDWRGRNEEFGRLLSAIRAGRRSVLPFMALGVTDSPQDQLLCARTWINDKFPASTASLWKGARYRHDRIRVAYLSADLREHVMAYCLLGLFESHDQARFETTAISFGPDVPSETRSRLMGAFSRFVDVRRESDREVANLLRELEIDIAVDLNGFTTDARTGIFALRAAPVQVNYLGYPGTMGAGFIDYIVADRFVIPEQHCPHYSEKVVYLPDTYMATDSRRVIADRTPARAEAGLPEQGFVFCSFNNNYKISPAVFDVWMRLLDKVEGSVLWLRGGGKEATRNLRNEAAHRGIAPERLVFAPRAERIEHHLARHRLADLALDTLPYNGHGTTSDALWAGLPVLTCLGTTFAGRVAASLLNAIGLPELITHSLPEYEALALELATNRERLADIRSKLAQNRGSYPLFDTDRFRRHIEAAYTTMWERHQRGEPPASFAVQPIDK